MLRDSPRKGCWDRSECLLGRWASHSKARVGVRKEAFGARGRETYFLRIKHILILLYIQNKLLSISHPSVAQGSFHSFCLVSFNNSLAANQRKGANYLISTVLFLCDQEMLLTSSHMGIALACHSDPVCSCLEPVLSYEGRRQTTRHQTLLTHGEGELRNLWVQDGTASPGLRLLPDSHHLPHGPPEEHGISLPQH